MSIGELAQKAGCPWEVFFESYVCGRHSAVMCATEGRLRELQLAAAKGVDGLEVLTRHLLHQIDANDMLMFKGGLLALTALTCVCQFAWSDFVVPRMDSATPMPSWQQQIADLHAQR